ncbi:hypothetical protein OSTOST_25671 [Ostertagia ostertagi]
MNKKGYVYLKKRASWRILTAMTMSYEPLKLSVLILASTTMPSSTCTF